MNACALSIIRILGSPCSLSHIQIIIVWWKLIFNMLSESVPLSLWLATAAGVASHTFIFIHKEWHVQAPTILKLYTFIFFALIASEGPRIGSLIAGCYCVALFSSIVLYRLLFHPLRRVPGPFLASVTKFWHVYRCLDSKNHLLLDRLCREYGPLVRTGTLWLLNAWNITRLSLVSLSLSKNTGPTEVTAFFPEILPAIDGPGTWCTKAVWYDLLLPELAVNTTRDKSMHDQRRRVWDHGFSTKGLKFLLLSMSLPCHFHVTSLMMSSIASLRRTHNWICQAAWWPHCKIIFSWTGRQCVAMVLPFLIRCHGWICIREIVRHVARWKMAQGCHYVTQSDETSWPLKSGSLASSDRLQHTPMVLGHSRLAWNVGLVSRPNERTHQGTQITVAQKGICSVMIT